MKYLACLLLIVSITVLQAQDSAVIYYKLGQQQYDAEEYEKAVSSFSKSIALLPTDSAYIQRAVCWRDANKAVLDYDTALFLNPKNWYALLSRGSDYSYLKNYKAAIKDFKSAIKMQPDSSQGYARLGTTLVVQKRYGLAIVHLSKAIERRSNSEYLHHWRGSAYYGNKNYELAIADFDKAEELNTIKMNLISIYIPRSFAKSFLGDKKGECEDLHKAANLGHEEAKRKYLEKCK